MHLEKKKIKGNDYYYLRKSIRKQGKVKKETIAYFGRKKPSKLQISERLAEYNLDYNKLFFTKQQLEKLELIKKSFAQKIKNKLIVQDMLKDFTTTYVYNTNAIEGNTLSLQQTDQLLNRQTTPPYKELREVYEHFNARDALLHILKKEPAINKITILDIHKKLLKNIDQRVGRFRQHDVRVFGAKFLPTQAQYVETDMHILLRWRRRQEKTLHPLLLAALFHEKFEKIHPFYDGNGRTGRMLINLELLRAGYPPLIIKNKNRHRYYVALSAGHKVDLIRIDVVQHKKIVDFCYQQLVKTYDELFAKWG